MVVGFAFGAIGFIAAFTFEHVGNVHHSSPAPHSSDPDSSSDVGRSDFSSRYSFPSHIIPLRGQVREDAPEVSVTSKESDHVFQEHIPRLRTSNDFDGSGPLILSSRSGSALACVHVVCEGKFLARKTRRYNVNHSFVAVSISVPNKVSDIATIDGCIVENPICNALGEQTARIGVPLHISECCPSEKLAAKKAATSTRE
jgi:hypothetical protein